MKGLTPEIMNRLPYSRFGSPALAFCMLPAWAGADRAGAEDAAAAGAPAVEKYNVVWDSPNESSFGSMPLGNGDIELNVWWRRTDMGAKGNAEYPGLSESFSAESLAAASEQQANLLKLNPNLIILAEIRCKQAEPNYLPDDHSWLMHDPNGNPIKTGDSKYIKLDLKNPEFREHIGQETKAAIDSGVFDGVMLNYLKDDELCLELIKSIRSAIGPNPLILCSSGPAVIANVAPYINGYYMECSRTDTPEDVAADCRYSQVGGKQSAKTNH